MPIATREQVDALKKNWKNDPCFDLWDMDEEEFLPYKEELEAYQIQCTRDWINEYQDKVTKKSIKLNCSDAMARYILELETTIEKLKEKIG